MSNEEIVKLGDVCQVGIVVKDANKVVEAWKTAFGFDKWRYDEMAGIDAKGRNYKARLVHYQFGPMDFELIQPVEGRIVHSRFLETYGEGIHHIAFPVADVATETAKLEKRPDFKLVIKTDRIAYFDTPGGIFELVPLRNDMGGTGSGGIVKLSYMCQVGFAVRNVDKVIASWKSAFGFDNWTFVDRTGTDASGRPWKVKTAHYRFGPMDLELVEPAEDRKPLVRFIEARENGIHHVAFRVDDVTATATKLETLPGFKMSFTNNRIAYIEIPGGVTIELMPQPSPGSH